MTRRKEREQVIIATSPNRRPYGVRLAVLLDAGTKFNIQGDCALLVSQNYIIRLVPNVSKPSTLHLPNQQCCDVLVEGFATAGEAEEAGLKVALGLLWGAVSRQFAARLLYTTPLPCTVYDRTKSKGLVLTGACSFEVGFGISGITEPLQNIISYTSSVDLKLLIAMDLFTSSRLEATMRSKFVGMVSSLEPLAEQQKYQNPELDKLLLSFKHELESSKIPIEIINSLKNRIDLLRTESVSTAIRRLVRQLFPDDPECSEIIDEAYGIRSRILHDGETDSDLELKGREVEAVIRRIFEEIIKREHLL